MSDVEAIAAVPTLEHLLHHFEEKSATKGDKIAP